MRFRICAGSGFLRLGREQCRAIANTTRDQENGCSLEIDPARWGDTLFLDMRKIPSYWTPAGRSDPFGSEAYA